MRARKICVAFPTSNHLHRRMIEGVVESIRGRLPWQFFLVTEDDGVQGLRQAHNWGAEGAIALGKEESWAREILAWHVPTVLFNCGLRRLPKNVVCLQRDQAGVGKTAAEYFLDRNYTNFAYIGSARPNDWSTLRGEGFERRLARAGAHAAFYDPPSPKEVADFGLEAPRLACFLRARPAGTALFVAHDRRAQIVLGLCLELGIRVPEQIAVLGVDDDRTICEALTPPLSSISLDGAHSGNLAAQILEELFAGQGVDPVLKLDFPRVITRQSTNSAAIDDTVLARTLALLTRDLSKPTTVSKVADELGYSVRTIELKARKVFGCTMKEKLNRLRLNEAVRLLSNSSATVREVAERCGFCDASHLGLRMKAAFGHGPSVFRHHSERE